LDASLLEFPLFLVMASGSRAFDIDSAGCDAKLLKSLGDGKVRVHLLRAHPPYEKEVWVRNVLPKYPQQSNGVTKRNAVILAVFINGPRKGELKKPEEDKVWVKKMGKEKKKDATEHSRFDLVLSRSK
jgi:hypothetical protein